MKKIGEDKRCPYCMKALEKKPGRKKKCPHCGEFIYVRTLPGDRKKVLITESQIAEIEEMWAQDPQMAPAVRA